MTMDKMHLLGSLSPIFLHLRPGIEYLRENTPLQEFTLTGSTTQSTLKYEDVVASFLSEEMRQKSMDGHNTDALFVRGRTQDKNPGNSLGWISKFIDRSKSPEKYLRKCWKCGKIGHYKKDCKSKKVEKPKGSDSTSSK